MLSDVVSNENVNTIAKKDSSISSIKKSTLSSSSSTPQFATKIPSGSKTLLQSESQCDTDNEKIISGRLSNGYNESKYAVSSETAEKSKIVIASTPLLPSEKSAHGTTSQFKPDGLLSQVSMNTKIQPFSKYRFFANVIVNGVPLAGKMSVFAAICSKPIGVASFYTLYSKGLSNIPFGSAEFNIRTDNVYIFNGLDSKKYYLAARDEMFSNPQSAGSLNEKDGIKSKHNNNTFLGSKKNLKDLSIDGWVSVTAMIDDGAYRVCRITPNSVCACRLRTHGILLNQLKEMSICQKFHTGKSYYIYGFGLINPDNETENQIEKYNMPCLIVSFDGHIFAIQNKFIAGIKYFFELPPKILSQYKNEEIVQDCSEFCNQRTECKGVKISVIDLIEKCRPAKRPTLSTMFKEWLVNFEYSDKTSFNELRKRKVRPSDITSSISEKVKPNKMHILTPTSQPVPPFAILPPSHTSLCNYRTVLRTRVSPVKSVEADKRKHSETDETIPVNHPSNSYGTSVAVENSDLVIPITKRAKEEEASKEKAAPEIVCQDIYHDSNELRSTKNNIDIQISTNQQIDNEKTKIDQIEKCLPPIGEHGQHERKSEEIPIIHKPDEAKIDTTVDLQKAELIQESSVKLIQANLSALQQQQKLLQQLEQTNQKEFSLENSSPRVVNLPNLCQNVHLAIRQCSECNEMTTTFLLNVSQMIKKQTELIENLNRIFSSISQEK